MRADTMQRRASDANVEAEAILVMQRKATRKYLEAMVRVYHPRTDLADFSNSDLEEILDIDEAERDARRPFDSRVAGAVLAVVIVIALLLSLQGCGGGDPEPEPDPTIGMVRETHDPSRTIRPVIDCSDHEREGTKQSQQWRDACDGAKT